MDTLLHQLLHSDGEKRKRDENSNKRLRRAKQALVDAHKEDAVEFHIGRLDRRLYAFVHEFDGQNLETTVRVINSEYNFKTIVGKVETSGYTPQSSDTLVDGTIDEVRIVEEFRGLRLCTPAVASHIRKYTKEMGSKLKKYGIHLRSKSYIEASSCYVHAIEQAGYYSEIERYETPEIPMEDAKRFGFYSEDEDDDIEDGYYVVDENEFLRLDKKYIDEHNLYWEQWIDIIL